MLNTRKAIVTAAVALAVYLAVWGVISGVNYAVHLNMSEI